MNIGIVIASGNMFVCLQVGPRVHSDSQMDGGNSFIQINDISPSMQQVIDSEIDRILNVSDKCCTA